MKIDPVKLVRMWNRGDLVRDIAERFDVSEAAVSKCARACGVPKRKPGRWREGLMRDGGYA